MRTGRLVSALAAAGTLAVVPAGLGAQAARAEAGDLICRDGIISAEFIPGIAFQASIQGQCPAAATVPLPQAAQTRTFGQADHSSAKTPVSTDITAVKGSDWVRWLPNELPAAGYFTLANSSDQPLDVTKIKSPTTGGSPSTRPSSTRTPPRWSRSISSPSPPTASSPWCRAATT